MEITFPREKDPLHYVLYYITYLLFLQYKFHTLIVSRRTFPHSPKVGVEPSKLVKFAGAH